eukprot:5695019-Amphidinium_carterae.1
MGGRMKCKEQESLDLASSNCGRANENVRTNIRLQVSASMCIGLWVCASQETKSVRTLVVPPGQKQVTAMEYVSYLGINLEIEPELAWIAREMLAAPMPPGPDSQFSKHTNEQGPMMSYQQCALFRSNLDDYRMGWVAVLHG